MKIAFVRHKFSRESLVMVERANQIIAEYQEQDLRLTLRQLYYQFVSRDLIANRQSEYKRLGGIISDGRLAGLIDWDAIEDRGRNLLRSSAWDTPADIIDACARSYRIDMWQNQPYYIEAWIEKEALIGVIGGICDILRVPHFACKGYVSQSEMFDAGYHRLGSALAREKRIVVLHMGDHDPSGIDMTRDVAERLSMFACADVTVKRLALNYDQIEQYAPPPNPAKATDSRFGGYRDKFGDTSWELDALNPTVLRDLIADSLREFIDRSQWRKDAAREATDAKLLAKVATRWPDVKGMLNPPR